MTVRIAAIWVSTRLLMFVAALVGSWAAVASGGVDAYVGLWRQWDTKWFESIALYGYVGPYVSAFEDFRYNVAFFPAFPGTLEVGTWFGIAPSLTGLIVSAIAGFFAALALGRLVKDAGGSATWGVIGWTVAPTALFITAAYTEAMFAAFAFWAWVFARRGSWVWAGALAAGAALTRSNGLFLAAGLVVMFLMAKPWKAVRPGVEWAKGLALLLPILATFAYFAYLHVITGSWTSWMDAQRDYWERQLVDPLTSLVNTYNLIFTFSPTGEPSSRMVTEIAAMAILVATVIVLVVKHWWPESTYVAVTAVALGTSTMYHSVPRTLVIVFPLWMLVGLWLTRLRWLRWVYVLACVPLLILVTMRFAQGQWIS